MVRMILMMVSMAIGCGASTLAKRDNPFGANLSEVKSTVAVVAAVVVEEVEEVRGKELAREELDATEELDEEELDEELEEAPRLC